MNFEEVKELINIIEKSSIKRVNLDLDGCHIELDKSSDGKALIKEDNVVQKEFSITKSEEKVNEEVKTGRFIKSPIVGTFYSAPSPGEDSFVKAGSVVEKGNVVCIIESMKLMNEIESDLDGEIAEVLVEDGAIVEYGQELFRVI